MSSQYNLQLKATLDTSQVQQELQKLKSAQMQAQHEAGAAGGGTAASSIASLDLKKLNATMTKLDQTMSGLQKALKTAVSPSSAAPAPGGRSMFLPTNLAAKANWKSWLKSDAYKQLDTKMKQAFSSLQQEEQQVLMMLAGVRDIRDPQATHKFLQRQEIGRGLFGRSFNYEGQVAAYQNSAAQQQLKQQKAQARFARGFGLLFGGQILGDIGGMVGGQAGAAIGAVGSGLQAGGGAAMTATMLGAGAAAGPIGVGVGLATAFSSLYTSAMQASAAISKMAEQMEEAYNAAHQTTMKNQRAVLEARHEANAGLLERTSSLDRAKEYAKHWKDSADSMKKQLAESDPYTEESKIRERAAARKAAVDRALKSGDVSWLDNDLASMLFHATGSKDVKDIKQEAYNKIDAEALEQIAAAQKNFESLQSEISSAEKIASMYQGVVDKIDAQQKKDMELSKAEVAKRVQLAEANDSTIFGYKQQTAASQTQAFADRILGDKTLGPLEKFSKIAEQLDMARANKNSALNEAFGIAKYLKQNEGKLDSAEVQAQMKKQAGFERDAAAQASLVGILESALASIQSGAVAPDLSHVTSLAQYGFNMGEKDDTVERMDKYYSRSLNLQEQIKNKLQEGITTEATYSE